MKAILLAGGKGTRLRPLTIHTPKPIVPIFGRPFLNYQIDLVKKLPEIDEVVLSLNYQPRRIEEMFGHGDGLGVKVSYVVEPAPLGTGGAVKYAGGNSDETVVVFNGDVMTQVDLAAVLRLHRERKAKATIVLTPVDNPTAYGLVETDPDGNVSRFLEKPKAEEITCDTINAGIYILEPDTFDRIPKDTAWSIERSYFPSLVERGETFIAYVYRGYWIDIGTPEKYCPGPPRHHGPSVLGAPLRGLAATFRARVPGRPHRGRREGGGTVLHRRGHHRESGRPHRPVHGPRAAVPHRGGRPDRGRRSCGRTAASGAMPSVRQSILGRHCHVGRNSILDAGVVLGDKSAVTDYSKL